MQSGGNPAPHPRATQSGSHVGPVLVSASSWCVWPRHGGVCFAKGGAGQTECRKGGHFSPAARPAARQLLVGSRFCSAQRCGLVLSPFWLCSHFKLL